MSCPGRATRGRVYALPESVSAGDPVSNQVTPLYPMGWDWERALRAEQVQDFGVSRASQKDEWRERIPGGTW